MHAPLLDHDPRFLEAVEDLAVEQLVPEPAVEGLVVAVLPRGARLDEERGNAKLLGPGPDRRRGELRAVVGADVFRHAAGEHDVGQGLDDRVAPETSLDLERQAFAGVLVDQGERAQRAAVVGLAGDEVVAPDVVGIGRSKAHARAVVEPQPCPGLLFGRHLQALLAPEALRPVFVHAPAGGLKQRRDAPVAVAAVLAGELRHRLGEAIFVFPDDWLITLCAPRMGEKPAGMPLGEAVPRPRLRDRLPSRRGA